MDSIARHILGLPGWAALVTVLVVPLLESSALVGFVFPGEIAVPLGAVLAFQHRVGLAGMARMRYRTFLLYNVAGGAAWATGMVLLGYLAGASWQQAAHWASRIGLALLALILLGFALRLAARATRRRADRLRAVCDRLAATAPVVWVRRRFPTQLGWLRRRLDPTTREGWPLTATLAAAALFAWIFGGLTQDVTAGEGIARFDPRAHGFAVAHRTDWLTTVLRNVTWLGSGWVLIPILATATVVLLRRRDRRGVGWVWAA